MSVKYFLFYILHFKFYILHSLMRTLSGIQPSGQLHLGNYFGSMKPNIDRIGGGESLYLIVDLHALTTVQDPEALKKYRRDAVLDCLACGFDPEKAILFFQSDVPEHAGLSWILSTVTPMGLLERAVSYKEKIEKGLPASAGLFTYPVMMAADILLYQANQVPVGRDQKQHVEITRDIAVKFNNTYSETFVLPEPMIEKEVAVVPGIDGQKMSKSYGNTIPIFGPEKAIEKTIMSIVTDSKAVSDPKDPETCTVFQIHKLFLNAEEQKALARRYKSGGLGYGDAKKLLFQAYLDYFGAMREKREDLLKKPDYVAKVIKSGAEKASVLAKKTMAKVREATGLVD